MKRAIVTGVLFCFCVVPAAGADGRIISSFDAVLEERRSVRFAWAIEPERDDEELTCTLDVDTDDPGNVDLSVTDCGETTTLDFTYDEPGTYEVALTATSQEGGSDRAIATVIVE
jgi:hypothetical protein